MNTVPNPEQIIQPVQLHDNIGETVSGWDRSAGEYLHLTPNVAYYQDTADAIAAAIATTGHNVIADVACGSNSLLLTRCMELGLEFDEYLCIDKSRPMIETMQGQLTDAKLKFINCTAENIDAYIHEPVDVVAVNNAIWMFDLSRALTAFTRILRPNGLLIFTVAQWDLAEFDAPASRYELINRALEDHKLPRKTQYGSLNKLEMKSVIQALRTAGFTQISFEDRITRMEVQDWANFYKIDAIRQKSLPEVPPEMSKRVLESAFSSQAANTELDPIQWRMISARYPHVVSRRSS